MEGVLYNSSSPPTPDRVLISEVDLPIRNGVDVLLCLFCLANEVFVIFLVVRKQLSSLLDSLLHLQHNMLLRHRGTRGLVDKDAPLSEHGKDDSIRISDEEIPSDSGSNEGSYCDEEAKDVERRRKRKRRCPWVRGS